jgi:hypothetical protein
LTWKGLDYVDPPKITFVSTPATTTTTAPVTVRGTGDAGDTIRLYDGTTLVGTATVGADGTWSMTVNLAVGSHTLTATQTVNQAPHAGLTSAVSKSASVTVRTPTK